MLDSLVIRVGHSSGLPALLLLQTVHLVDLGRQLGHAELLAVQLGQQLITYRQSAPSRSRL